MHGAADVTAGRAALFSRLAGNQTGSRILPWTAFPTRSSTAHPARFSARLARRRFGFGGSELAVTASLSYFAMGLLYEVSCSDLNCRELLP